ncbi:MAG TPA: hypothetical protein DGT21_25045 [Armatimonadetes bacterium]|nr:hypothetical protein [Armatimonadota bacterium]
MHSAISLKSSAATNAPAAPISRRRPPPSSQRSRSRSDRVANISEKMSVCTGHHGIMPHVTRAALAGSQSSPWQISGCRASRNNTPVSAPTASFTPRVPRASDAPSNASSTTLTAPASQDTMQ